MENVLLYFLTTTMVILETLIIFVLLETGMNLYQANTNYFTST